MENSIKVLAEKLNEYNRVKSLEVFTDNSFMIHHYEDNGEDKGARTAFKTADSALEWLENNML